MTPLAYSRGKAISSRPALTAAIVTNVARTPKTAGATELLDFMRLVERRYRQSFRTEIYLAATGPGAYFDEVARAF
jgi:hypothetical protein